ncbi:hypothetical protein GCM10027566_20800 [Arachidicoccus ginsenosidivorans]
MKLSAHITRNVPRKSVYTRLIALSWLFAGLFLLCQPASAQTHYLDSLKKAIQSPSITDSVKASTLQEIGYHLVDSDPKEGRKYFWAAYLLCAKNQWVTAMGSSAGYMGQSFYTSNEFDSAFHYLDLARKAFEKDTTPRAGANLGVILNIQANIEKAQGKYQAAIEHYLASNEAVGKVESKERAINLGIGYINIALVFKEMKQYQNVIDYCKKAINLFDKEEKKLSDSAYLKILNGARLQGSLYIADAYINLGALSTAGQILDNLQKAVKEVNSHDLSAFYYTELGNYYKAGAFWGKAQTAYNQALSFAAKIDRRKTEPLLALAEIAAKQQNYSASTVYARSALSTQRAHIKPKVKAQALKLLAEALLANKQYPEAARQFQAYATLSDSLNSAQAKIKINEIENKYQNKQKADSILVLTKNSQMQLLALHKKESQNIFIIIATCLLLLTGLLFYRNLRHKHLLLKKSEEFQHQQILQLEQERQLIAAQSLMKGQEQERSRLARDLHDGVGGLLSGVKLRLSSMKGNFYLPEESAISLQGIIGQLDNSIQELRRVSHNMMPEALIKYGLKEALENYTDYIQSSGALQIQLQLYGLEHRLNQDTEIILYRIVQELLTNVIKHAQATNVLLQFIRNNDRFTLTVEDNGKGFDKDPEGAKNGAGLSNINARVAYLNGNMDINTAPGKGCSITIEGAIRQNTPGGS